MTTVEAMKAAGTVPSHGQVVEVDIPDIEPDFSAPFFAGFQVVASYILAGAMIAPAMTIVSLLVADPADRATVEEEHALELRVRDRERKLLKKVDKSLRMVDDGSFGWCEETGEPIGIARLIARPTASLSIEAQERRERMQKLFGD